MASNSWNIPLQIQVQQINTTKKQSQAFAIVAQIDHHKIPCSNKYSINST